MKLGCVFSANFLVSDVDFYEKAAQYSKKFAGKSAFIYLKNTISEIVRRNSE